MHFAILGTGDVGRDLATGLHGHGHDVTIGTRDPGAPAPWAQEAGFPIHTFEEAAEAAEAAVLCTAWAGAGPVAAACAQALSGKLVIDVTNPLAHSGSGLALALAGDDSGGESVQRALPHSQVVKCWNTINSANMIDPKTSEAPTMFIAGNDRQAKEDVRSLLFECGWKDVVDCGGIAASRYLEAMTMVWITVAGQTGGTGHAFRLVRG